MNKAEALRKAKLDYISSVHSIYAHPAFWSPFIQIGDSRCINVSIKGSEYYIYIIGLIGVFLAIFFIRSKFKPT